MKRLILLLLFTASAWAQPLEVQTSQNAGSTLRPLTTQQQATVWGVTPEEWQRYLTLKQQARGVWSPGLDPLPPWAWRLKAIMNASASPNCWSGRNTGGWRKNSPSSARMTQPGSVCILA